MGLVAGPMLGAGFGAVVITAPAAVISAAIGAVNAFDAPSRVVGN
ncbi:hypothetical protein ACQPXH_14355 [Nocardia sp. CA-135953]